ncbi:MAG: ABC transporter permease subunit, partial [Mariniphaga sp.]|nr:ABC transporter permease subunit [Mariniphaga sp.]
MLALIVLSCMGSLYTALDDFSKAIKASGPEDTFFFLKLFTHSDGTLPSFIVFVSFLGPLLGISMGFDSINSEQNNGTLSRVLAQPIFRDFVLNAKFMAALIVLG